MNGVTIEPTRAKELPKLTAVDLELKKTIIC